MLKISRRHALRVGVAALATRDATALAATRRSVALDARLQTRDIVTDELTAGFLTDAKLGRGTVDYTYDRSTGGQDAFRVFYANGWFDVKLSLTYAPTTVTGSGRITGACFAIESSS